MTLVSRGRHFLQSGRSIHRTVRRLRGRRAAVGVLLGSACALLFATVRAGGGPRRQNAVRHFAWSAWMTTAYDVDLALAVGEGHERGSGRPLDSEADRRNNAAGRAHGQGAQVGGPAPLSLWRLAGEGAREWRAGRLWMVAGDAVVPSA